MALWQFKIWFVPSGAVGSRTSLTERECEEAEWWGRAELPAGYQSRLSSILPETESWHKDLLQWGKQDGDLIEVWLEGAKVDSVEARIDCRNLSPQFIRQVFDVAGDWGCRLVYDRDRTVLPEDLEGLIQAIWDSPNHKFMEAPAEWLPKLAREVQEHVPAPLRPSPRSMHPNSPINRITFEEANWTPRALEVLATARALMRPPGRIMAVHLLRALEVGDHIASRVLKRLAISPAAALGQPAPASLSQRVQLYSEDFEVCLQPDFPRLAYEEAREMGSLFLGTEHILLCVARISIPGLELPYERIRQAVLEARSSG